MADTIQLPAFQRERKPREIEIIAKAAELFSERGYQGASLAQVAKAVGLTEQGVLHYFPSKVHLLQGVLEMHELQEYDDYYALFLAEKKDFAGLLQFVEQLVSQNQKIPGMVQLFTMLVSESIRSDHPSHDYFVERYRLGRAAYVEQFLKLNESRLRSPADQETLAVLIMAVMDGLQIQWLLDPERVDMLAAFRLFTNIVAAYLQPA